MERLFKHINQYARISVDQLEQVQSYFKTETFKKKENILEIGHKSKRNYFVLSGCLQMFSVDEKGKERTIQFALENWWMTDNLAFMHQDATHFCIQAIEATEVLSISFEDQEKLLYQFPQVERYFRNVYQIAYGAAMQRMNIVFSFSKEERYFHFIESFPVFAQRVPQYLLASFLGLTPEYVSELRKKKRS